MKYKIENLSPKEFEQLCSRILSKIESLDFRFFKVGKDGGIDLEAEKGNSKYIAQCKRYTTDFSTLKSAIKKEVDRDFFSMKIEDYFLLTSLPISNGEREELFNVLKETGISSKNNIYDGTFIDDFLDRKENNEILKDFLKLWLINPLMLSLIYNPSIMIDCDILTSEIEEKNKYFVATQFYYKSIEILENNNTLLITGDPGVGKTTLSYMIILNALKKCDGKNISIRYSAGNNINELKKAICVSHDETQIILMDDFLGQIYNISNYKEHNELINFIKYVNKSKNIKLILNSRIGILTDVKSKNEKFNYALNELSIINLDVNNLTILEKAKILYNYLFFNISEQEFYKAIIRNKNYIKIIQNKNYNPRLIQYVCSEQFIRKCFPNNYFNSIVEILNNPKEIWKEEYNRNLNELQQFYILSIFSITNDQINESIIKNIFNSFVSHKNKSISKGEYDITYQSLNGSFIKTNIINDSKKVGLISHSMNDFLNSYINLNEDLLASIISNSFYVDQIFKILKINENSWKSQFDERVYQRVFNIDTNVLAEYNFSNNLLKLILLIAKKDKNTSEFKEILSIMFGNNNLREQDYLYCDGLISMIRNNLFFKKEFFNFLSDCFLDKLASLSENLSLGAISLILDELYDYDFSIIEENELRISNLLKKNYADRINDTLYDICISTLFDLLDSYEIASYIEENGKESLRKEIAQELNKAVQTNNEYLDFISLAYDTVHLSITDEQIDMVIKTIDIDSYINEDLKDNEPFDIEDRLLNQASEDKEIDDLFLENDKFIH